MALRCRKWICAEGFRSGVLSLSGMIAVASLIGCNSIQEFRTSTHRENRIRTLERELREKRAIVEHLQERNSVLEKRERVRNHVPASVSAQPIPVPFDPTAANSRINPPPTPAIAPLVETSSSPPNLSGEQLLYSKVLETYRRRDSGELQKTLALLLKTYRDSVYADNALYLAGLLALERNEAVEASRYMQKILKDYPGGNKAVSALLTEAMIKKNGRKFHEALRLLRQVRERFPGSPEAARAKLEIKSLETTAGQRRES